MHSARHIGLIALITALLAVAVPVARGQDAAWIPAPDLPTPRSGLAAAVIGEQIYVVGGRDDRGRALDVLERFDVTTGEWETLRPMPTARFDAAVVAYRGRLVVIGGHTRRGQGQGSGNRQVLGVVEVYDPQRNEWREVDGLEEERAGHVAFILRDTLFVAGGSNKDQRIIGSVEYMPLLGGNLDEKEWHQSTFLKLGIPRAAMAVAVVAGRAFAFGGFSPIPVNFVHEFRNSRFQLELPAGTFRARGAHAAVAVGDTILLLGGRGPGGNSTSDNPVLADVDLFMATRGEWRKGPAMRTPRESFAAVAVGSTVYAVGGRDEEGRTLASMESLRLSTGTDTEIPSEAAASLVLHQNAPNPFSNLTSIEYAVPSGAVSPVLLEVYDLQGRRVRSLVSGSVPPGVHRVTWDGRTDSGARLAAGVYLYRLTQGAQTAHRKLVLVH